MARGSRSWNSCNLRIRGEKTDNADCTYPSQQDQLDSITKATLDTIITGNPSLEELVHVSCDCTHCTLI
jgi:hypothetical protein